MNFGEIITQAWKFTWKYKTLWLFGLFASCTSHTGSGSGSVNWQSSGGEMPARIEGMMGEMAHLGTWILEHPLIIVAAVLLWLMLLLLAWGLGLLGIGGLVAGIAEADDNQPETIPFSWLWQRAEKTFLPLLVLSLVNIGVVLLSLLVAYGPGLALLIGGAIAEADPLLAIGAALFCLGFLVWLALLLVWQVVYFFARFATVLEAKKLWPAIVQGWKVFWGNIGSVVVLGLIVMMLNIAFALLVMLPATPAILAFMRWMNGADVPLLRIIIINMAFLIPWGWALAAVYETFRTGIWTLAYRDMTRPAAPPTDAIIALATDSEADEETNAALA